MFFLKKELNAEFIGVLFWFFLHAKMFEWDVIKEMQ